MSTIKAVASSPTSDHSLRSRVFRGGTTIAVGSLMWQALRLISAMVLARLLGPEQFGVASMLLLVVSFTDMASNASLDKQLVQASDGDSVLFLSTSHAFAALRGAVAAVLLLLLAAPVSRLFGVSEYSWAFAALAIVPLCNGISHLDRKRVQRNLRFAPDMWVEFIAQVGSLFVGTLVAWRTHHFTAAMWALLCSAFVSMATSHYVAERPYRWSWRKSIVLRLVHFGWPLVLSNILLFAILQGERGLLAAAPQIFPDGPYTAKDLGLFAAAGTLAYAPVVIITRLASTLALPLLSAAKEDTELFRSRYRRIMLFLVLCGLGIFFSFSLMGPWLLRLLYGTAFDGAAGVLFFMAVAQAIRVIRVAPAVGSLAHGDSRNSLWANVARLSGCGLALWVLASSRPIEWLAASAAVSEMLSLLVAAWCFAKIPIASKTEPLEAR